jgi:hypothetical protein
LPFLPLLGIIIGAFGVMFYATKRMKSEYEKSLMSAVDKEDE